MLQHHLDAVFHALADPTRRAMVERLAAGPTSVSELGAPFPMSLSAIGQHVQLLEASGLVRTAKVGRVRQVALVPDTLSAAERWFTDHRARWARRLDRLGDLLAGELDGADTRPAPVPTPEAAPRDRAPRTPKTASTPKTATSPKTRRRR